MTDQLDTIIRTLERLTMRGCDPAHPDQPLNQVVARRMDDARRGHPGSSMGGGSGRSNGSPVESALTQPDIGGDALKRWNAALRAMMAGVVTLDRLALAWAPRQPDARALEATAQANVHLCEHCGDEPLRANAPTDVQGNLTDPIRLGWWCYKMTVKLGRLPDARMVERHRKGQRIMIDA